MSAIAWNTVYPCMFRPPLTAKKQENGHLKNAPRPALRGGVRWQVGALRPPALSCTVFNLSVHTPNTEQSPARISGLTAIPVGTPAQSPHTAFQAGGGYGCQLGGKTPHRGAQRANRALSGRSHLRRFHRCDLRFHLCRKLQQRLPVFFSAVLAHLVQDRTLFLGIKLVSHLVASCVVL